MSYQSDYWGAKIKTRNLIGAEDRLTLGELSDEALSDSWIVSCSHAAQNDMNNAEHVSKVGLEAAADLLNPFE
jgi:hypothetical protein